MMEPKPGNRKSLRPLTRWFVVPVAFAWLGFMLMAPFALADEIFAYGGLIFGFLIGLVVAINDPKWVVEKERVAIQSRDGDIEEIPLDESRSPRPMTLPTRLILTAAAGGFSWLVVWAVRQQNISDRGIIFFVAAFFVISMVRRTLRKAWGLNGSLAGMLVCGALLVLLIESSMDKPDDSQKFAWIVAVPFIIVEAWDELRALKRERT